MLLSPYSRNTVTNAGFIPMSKCFAFFASLAVSALVALSGPPAEAVENPEGSWDFHKAQTALQEGNYDKAIPILRRFAEEGNASAQWQLGGLYMDGTGVHKDLELASMWYRKALAEVPANIPENPPEPDRTFRDDWNFLVLHLGRLRVMCPDITARLGAMYFKGDGIQKDDIESYKWFELAKHYGYAKAAVVQEFVGESMSEEKIDEAETRAARWLTEHAEYDDTIVKQFMPTAP